MSVVIPAYNAASYLREAINSVIDQTYPDTEVIVVDDGSTDGTVDVIESYGSQVKPLPLARKGVAHARNEGARHATGEFIAFLDADDLWLPRKLEHQVRVLTREPTVGLVYTGLHLVDETLTFIGRQPAPSPQVALWNTLMLERPVMCGIGTGVIRREVFEESAGFDDRLSTSADCDLACRIATRHAVAAVDKPLLLYRQHHEQMHRDLDKTLHDMDLIFKKFFDDKVAPAWMLPYKTRAYANLYVSLAGSALMKGDRRAFARYVTKATLRRPDRVLDAVKRLSDPATGAAPIS